MWGELRGKGALRGAATKSAKTRFPRIGGAEVFGQTVVCWNIVYVRFDQACMLCYRWL